MNRRQFVVNGSLFLTSFPALAKQFKTFNANPIKVGVIGTGVRGTYLLRLIVEHIHTMRVVACCDINSESLERGLKLAGPQTKSYQDYKDLLKDKEVEAVIIATPLYLHFAMASEAMAQKKHVYCEKTMCFTIEESKELIKTVRSSPLVFQVGYQQRYSPLLKKVRQLIQNGACGKITYVDCYWNRNGDWRRRVKNPEQERLINWRMYKAYSGGLMAELCSHQIDVVHMLLGQHPKSVIGMGGIDYWKDGRETFDNVTALFEYPEGLKARFTALTTNAREGFKMKFFGTKATIEINRENGQKGWIFPEPPPSNPAWEIDALSGVTQTGWNEGEGIRIISEDEPNDELSTTIALKEFSTSIKTNKKPYADVQIGHWGSVAVQMANEAMEKGLTVQWKPHFNAEF